jgi:hypothetical protein
MLEPRRRVTLASIALLLALGAFGRASHALAQDAPARAARLFDEAQARMDAHDFVAACAMLRESQALDPQLGTLLHLGHCLEKQGKTASAWSTFRAAAALAAKRNATGNVEPREEVARRRAARLEPNLSTLRIDVHDAAPSLVVSRDGQPVPAAEWNTAVPVDPGLHTLRATSPGHFDWDHVVEIDKPATHVQVAVPALRPNGAAGPPMPRDAAAPDSGASEGALRQRSIAYALAGAGAVGLTVALGFGLAAEGAVSDRQKLCPHDECALLRSEAERVQGYTEKASRNASRANVALALGVALITAGVVVYLTAPRSESRASVAIGPAAVALRVAL